MKKLENLQKKIPIKHMKRERNFLDFVSEYSNKKYLSLS